MSALDRPPTTTNISSSNSATSGHVEATNSSTSDDTRAGGGDFTSTAPHSGDYGPREHHQSTDAKGSNMVVHLNNSFEAFGLPSNSPQPLSTSNSPQAPHRRNSLSRRNSNGSSEGLSSPGGLGSPMGSPGKTTLRRLNPPVLRSPPVESAVDSHFATDSNNNSNSGSPAYPQQQTHFEKPPAHPSDLRSPNRRRASVTVTTNTSTTSSRSPNKNSPLQQQQESQLQEEEQQSESLSSNPYNLTVLKDPSIDEYFDEDGSSPPHTSKTHIGRPLGLPEIIPPAQSADDLASTGGGYGAGISEASDFRIPQESTSSSLTTTHNNLNTTGETGGLDSSSTAGGDGGVGGFQIMMRGPNGAPLHPHGMRRRSSLGSTGGSPKFLAFGRRGSTDSLGGGFQGNMVASTPTAVGGGGAGGDSHNSLPGAAAIPPQIGVDESASNVDDNSPQFYGNNLAQLETEDEDDDGGDDAPLTTSNSVSGGRPLLQSAIALLNTDTTQQQGGQGSASANPAPRTMKHKDRRESLSSLVSSSGGGGGGGGRRSASPQATLGGSGGLRAFGALDAVSPHAQQQQQRGGSVIARHGNPLTLQVASPHSLQISGCGGRGGNLLSPSPANSAISAQVSRQGSLLRTTSGMTHKTPRDWPSEIIPNFLYLGGQRAANSKQRMEERGITRYLCCAFDASLPQHVEQSRLDSGEVIIKHLKLKDGAKTQLKEHFAEAFGFIRATKKQGKRIFIYCREGKSRSASIVIGYFMKYMELSYTQALNAVRQRRSVVDPNFAFCHQLDEFEEQTAEIPGSAADTPNSMWLNAHVGGSALSAISRAHQHQHQHHHRLSFMSNASSTAPHNEGGELVVLGALGLPPQQVPAGVVGGISGAVSPTSDSYSPHPQHHHRGGGGGAGGASDTALAPPPFALPKNSTTHTALSVQTVDSGFFEPLSTTTASASSATTSTGHGGGAGRAVGESSFSPVVQHHNANTLSNSTTATGPNQTSNTGNTVARILSMGSDVEVVASVTSSCLSPARTSNEGRSVSYDVQRVHTIPTDVTTTTHSSSGTSDSREVTATTSKTSSSSRQHTSNNTTGSSSNKLEVASLTPSVGGAGGQGRSSALPSSLPSFDSPAAIPLTPSERQHQQHLSIQQQSRFDSEGRIRILPLVGGGLSQPATPSAGVTPTVVNYSDGDGGAGVDVGGGVVVPSSSSVQPPRLTVDGGDDYSAQSGSTPSGEGEESDEGGVAGGGASKSSTASIATPVGVMNIFQQFTPSSGEIRPQGSGGNGGGFFLSEDLPDGVGISTGILGAATTTSNSNSNNNNTGGSSNNYLSSREAEELFLFSGEDEIDPSSFLSPEAATALIRELSDDMVDESEKRTASRQDGAVTPRLPPPPAVL